VGRSSGELSVTVTEYQQRVQECLDLAATMPMRARLAILKIAEAWLKLAEDALTCEEMFEGQNAPTSDRMQ
jgi:hypothetical protein